jgi:hypothetical protein
MDHDNGFSQPYPSRCAFSASKMRHTPFAATQKGCAILITKEQSVQKNLSEKIRSAKSVHKRLSGKIRSEKAVCSLRVRCKLPLGLRCY